MVLHPQGVGELEGDRPAQEEPVAEERCLRRFIVVRGGYPWQSTHYGPFTKEEAEHCRPILMKGSTAQIVELKDPVESPPNYYGATC